MSKILYFNPEPDQFLPDDVNWQAGTEVQQSNDWSDTIDRLANGTYDGLCIAVPPDQGDALSATFRDSAILDQMPDGIALIDSENRVLRVNQRLTNWFQNQKMVGLHFFDAIGQPKIIGPELTPLRTCRFKKQNTTCLLQQQDRFFQMNVAPFLNNDIDGEGQLLILTIRDTTIEAVQRQKMNALRQAGNSLADLRPEEIFEMDFTNRIDLVKDNIIHYTRDLLNFDVVEIRLLDQETGRLEPLLSVGIDAEASKQPLFANTNGNGVTGFVVSTGHSYMCEDTTNDPLYLSGLIGAKSSLTVPLIFHDQVIGSFNVESPKVGAFSDSDLQFVEAFALEIAKTLNTLDLLTAQQTNAAQQSVEAIHAAVALPIDEILNDAVNVIESYIGHDTLVVKRLRAILKNARDVKQVIQEVGKTLAPVEALPASVQVDQRPVLRDTRILVIDADEQVRTSAHQLLERYGCIVETAHDGEEAIMMVRNCDQDVEYDAIIADIRLPDMRGYDLMVKLQELINDPPMILMTGFGYDPGHSIVKAREAGLHPNAILYKPFRLDQLLQTCEMVVQASSGDDGPPRDC